MKQQFKRILSVFLIFAMIVSFFPMQIKAADLEEDLPADDSSQEVEAIEPEQDATDSVDVQHIVICIKRRNMDTFVPEIIIQADNIKAIHFFERIS